MLLFDVAGCEIVVGGHAVAVGGGDEGGHTCAGGEGGVAGEGAVLAQQAHGSESRPAVEEVHGDTVTDSFAYGPVRHSFEREGQMA